LILSTSSPAILLGALVSPKDRNIMENAFGQPQNVVVLGGTSEIAHAIVTQLVKARTRTVVLAGRNAAALAHVETSVRSDGATSTAVVIFDALDPSNASATVSACFDAVGAPVDLVIIAVGMLGHQLTNEDDAVAAAQMATVNFTWPVAALAEIRRRLVAQGTGRILVMSSAAAVRVRRSTYLYGGAKAGLDRLSDALADSLIGTGVTLQILRSGPVRTKMIAGLPEAPMTSDPDQVATTTLKALSGSQRIIYSPPVLKYALGVLRHLPAPLWRKVMANR
jgi:decaprenylphospho-beta-D-erythro-pentofuranosid-2-ulose 2-reductase